MKKAYSYQRFSSIKQREGDSLRRQQQAALSFCKQFNLQLESVFKDENVSGWKGKNFSNESALGQFLNLVKAGTVEAGSVLLIENMDRLSRQSIMPCMSKFSDIIYSGVSIGVLSLNKIFDEESITSNPTELIMVLVEFMRANNESQTKSTRAKSAIQSKIERIKKGEKIWFGAMEPSWITGLHNGVYAMDSNKVKLVKDIFKLYLDGDSCSKIAASLNHKRVPTLRGLKAGIWTNVTVSELLHNKNVIGQFKINGNVFDNYFPSIIDTNTFQLTQHKLDFNIKNRGGSKYGLIRNLFKGLLFCEVCGQAIETKIATYKTVKGSVNQYADYICRGVKQNTGCANHGRVSVKAFEVVIFENILLKQPSELQDKPVKHDMLAKLDVDLIKLQSVISRLEDAFADPDFNESAGVKDKLKQALKDRELLITAIEKQKAKAAQISALPDARNTLFSLMGTGDKKSVMTNMQRLMDSFNAYMIDTGNRAAIRNLMPSIFEKLTIRFISGQHSLKVIIFCRFIDGRLINTTIEKDINTNIYSIEGENRL